MCVLNMFFVASLEGDKIPDGFILFWCPKVVK